MTLLNREKQEMSEADLLKNVLICACNYVETE